MTLPLAPALEAASGPVEQRATVRVIVDNDFAGDPDGLVALAHQLLSPKARTTLVTCSALDAKLARMAGLDPTRTAAAGAKLVRELLRRIGGPALPAVAIGAETFEGGTGQASAAAHAIVLQALRDDPLPLVLACGGPLTNVAGALRLAPQIAQRMTVAWIGGSAADDGAAEYNQATDPAAARFVLEQSGVPVLRVPLEEYRRFQVSVAELNDQVRAISPLARWLVDQYRNLPPFVQLGGAVTFGDSPLVSLTAFDQGALAPGAGRSVRVVRELDPRLNFADFVSLLRLHAHDRRRPA